MPSIFHPDTIWEHTLTEILNHDNKSEVGIIIRTWVKHHKLDDFSSLFNQSPDKFTPSSPLSYYKEKADSVGLLEMPSTPRTFNISWINLTMIIMMKSLIILSVNTTGCLKQEDNL